MIKNISKSLIIVLIFFFFFTVFKYYISEQNINLVKSQRKSFETLSPKKISELPVLPNDTNNIIEFNSGFEETNQQNYKRNFWELFK